jgi:hypothetical protein
MARLRPVPAACHASAATFVHSERPREVHPRLPPPGHNTPGFGTPLQRPLPGRVTESEDSATSRAREACHCVNGQGQAGLHPQRDRPREQLQPASLNTPGRSTISHAATALHKNYTLRPSHSFPCSLRHLSRYLRGGGGDVGTSHSANRHSHRVVRVRVTLRLTVCQSVCLGVEPCLGRVITY